MLSIFFTDVVTSIIIIITYYASKTAHHIYTIKSTHANVQHKILKLK